MWSQLAYSNGKQGQEDPEASRPARPAFPEQKQHKRPCLKESGRKGLSMGCSLTSIHVQWHTHARTQLRLSRVGPKERQSYSSTPAKGKWSLLCLCSSLHWYEYIKNVLIKMKPVSQDGVIVCVCHKHAHECSASPGRSTSSHWLSLLECYMMVEISNDSTTHPRLGLGRVSHRPTRPSLVLTSINQHAAGPPSIASSVIFQLCRPTQLAGPPNSGFFFYQ